MSRPTAGGRATGGKVALTSLGCSKNLVDSENVLGFLAEAGFTAVNDPMDADVILVNTCGFIDPAKEESIETILRLAGLKKRPDGPRGIVAMGCLVQQYAKDLKKSLPEVDAFVGFKDYPRIGEICTAVLAGKRPSRVTQERVDPPWSAHRVRLTPRHHAYLKVAEGCDHRCSFCSIPLIRGDQVSVPVEEIARRARELVESGAIELNLISQDTTHYGTDIYGEKAIHRVLEALSRIEGLRWVRVLYAYPAHVDDRLLGALADLPRMAPYLDMPLQHASDSMLRSMKRSPDRAGMYRLLEKIRARVPGITMRTTFLVGCPGETARDHRELLAFVEEGWFDRVGVFPYSAQEGTPYHEADGQVSEATKAKRVEEVMLAQQGVLFPRLEHMAGKRVEAVVDAETPGADGRRFCRTSRHAPEVDGGVLVEGLEAPAGSVVEVEVTGRDGYDLVARVPAPVEQASLRG